MALFTPLRSPDMNTRMGLAPSSLPVHLLNTRVSCAAQARGFVYILSSCTWFCLHPVHCTIYWAAAMNILI